MKITRREALATAAALLLPSIEPPAVQGSRFLSIEPGDPLPIPRPQYGSWNEVAELLTQLDSGAIQQTFGRHPDWMHYVSAIQFSPDVAAFFGAGPPKTTAKDLGHLTQWFQRDRIPILGKHSTQDSRAWAVMAPARLSADCRAEFAASRERFGLKPFGVDADWQGIYPYLERSTPCPP